MRALALTSLVIAATGMNAAPALAVAGTPAIDAALAAHYGPNAPVSYQYALVDLNGDGVPDAVVLINDRDYCGSGGCNLAILRGTGQSFSYVSGSTISRAPIKALKETRHGWRSLSVLVAGGGAIPGEALMRFDGHRYPLNPSMQPYAKAKDMADSTTLIHAK